MNDKGTGAVVFNLATHVAAILALIFAAVQLQAQDPLITAVIGVVTFGLVMSLFVDFMEWGGII